MKKVYIAGAISGLDLAGVKAKFAKKTEELKAMGYDVYNPYYEIAARGMTAAPYNDIMKVCIAELMSCEELHLMPDWQQSPGATKERNAAMLVEMKIVYP